MDGSLSRNNRPYQKSIQESLWTIWHRKESLGLSLVWGYPLLPATIKSSSNGRGIRQSTKLPDSVSVLQHFSRHSDHDLITDTDTMLQPEKSWHKQLSLETMYYLDPQDCKREINLQISSIWQLWPHMTKTMSKLEFKLWNSVNSFVLIPKSCGIELLTIVKKYIQVTLCSYKWSLFQMSRN